VWLAWPHREQEAAARSGPGLLIRPDSNKKELNSMGRHRGLLSLALTVWIGLMASEARAELISMTLSVDDAATEFSPDPFATRLPAGANTSYVVSPAGIAAINGCLAANDPSTGSYRSAGPATSPATCRGN